MIREEPSWTFRRESGLTQYYGNVETFGDRVVGQWFCLDADTGIPVWQREMSCPNMTTGVADGIIVATEFVIQGPASYSRGVYGLSLDTGETLWQADDPPPSGGVISRFFHRIGLLYGMDSPTLVLEGKVHCTSGRILNAADGSEHAPQGARNLASIGRNRSEQFYDKLEVKLETVEGRFVSSRRPGGDPANLSGGPYIYGINSNRTHDWEFNLSDQGYSTFSNYYSQRLVGDRVYLFGKEGPYYEETDDKFVMRPREATVHFITVDAITGEVTQDFTLPEPTHEYRIESVSPTGLLISHSNTWLAFYPFV